MNYYDEIINKIENLIDNQEYDEALRLVKNELDVAYIPKDIEEKLHEFLYNLQVHTYKTKTISDEDIEKFLNMDEAHQLLAVNELDHKNLRDYIALCQKYLNSSGFKNGKVLLIDSLIRQEINHEFTYDDSSLTYEFNPSNLKPIEQTDGYLKCLKMLEDHYMKEPSFLIMAKQLLAKEALSILPLSIVEEESEYVFKKITDYIYNALNNME